MSTKIEALNRAIAEACAASRPDQWSECIFEYKAIERYAFAEMQFKNPPGDSIWPDFDNEILHVWRELRAEMAQLNGGEAWYSAVFRMTPDGKYKFDFDYDHLPVFDFMPQADKWQDEFKRYPRPELQAQIQDWLDGPGTDEKSDELIQRLANLQRTV